MKLYTQFYGRMKEEAINSSVSGSPGSFHIGTGPQGMKGKGHSGRQNSKKGTCSRNRQHYHIATAQCSGQKKRVTEDGAEKKEMRDRFWRGSYIMTKINGATTKTLSSGLNCSFEARARVLKTFPQLTNVTIFLDSSN